MGSLHDQFQSWLGRPVITKDSESLLRPEYFAARNGPAETARAAYSLCFGEIHLALPQGIFGALALGIVFTGDQDNQFVPRPPYRLGIFTDPEDCPVAADLSDLPAVRPARIFGAGSNVSLNECPVFLKEDIQHGLPDQLADRVTELRGAERVHRQDGSCRVDHEVHDRVMFEHFPPL